MENVYSKSVHKLFGAAGRNGRKRDGHRYHEDE